MGLNKKWIYKSFTNKYPCIYTINIKNELSLYWSSINNKGHFNIPKFIFTNGSGFIYDKNGEYGLTQWAYAIPCEENNKNDIEKAFNSEKFENIMNAICLTSNRYNYNIIKLFKKDFWKELL